MRMMEIYVDTIAEGHEKVVRDILLEGDEVITEDGELTIEWPPWDPYVIHVSDPFRENMVSNVCMFGRRAMDEYARQLLNVQPKGEMTATYYYSNRLFDYPVVDEKELDSGELYYGIVGDGDGQGVDQIRMSIVNRLYKELESRRAIAITWHPELDISSDEPPCLQLVQCVVRDQVLHMVCYFRSNDMLSAWGANAYGLAHLMKYICDTLNDMIYDDYAKMGLSDSECRGMCIGYGTLTTISTSAHIYWKRDKHELDRFRRKLNV